jgi:hypothetical protein
MGIVFKKEFTCVNLTNFGKIGPNFISQIERETTPSPPPPL